MVSPHPRSVHTHLDRVMQFHPIDFPFVGEVCICSPRYQTEVQSCKHLDQDSLVVNPSPEHVEMLTPTSVHLTRVVVARSLVRVCSPHPSSCAVMQVRSSDLLQLTKVISDMEQPLASALARGDSSMCIAVHHRVLDRPVNTRQVPALCKRQKPVAGRGTLPCVRRGRARSHNRSDPA